MAIMRLDKFLSNMGLDSRKGVRSYLRSGAVTVDGIVVKNHDFKVNTEKNVVKVYDEVVEYIKYIYLIMNKPAGLVSSTEGERDEETVLSVVSDDDLFYAPFPVGRLDKDSTGLLLLTNDGAFAHRVTSPKKHVEKEYRVELRDIVLEQCVATFEKGVVIDEYLCRPAKLIITGERIANVIITEGKFHQIKRMFAVVGNEVVSLKRTRFGRLSLPDDLTEGEYRHMSGAERALFGLE